MIRAILGSWGALAAWRRRRRRVVTAGFERRVALYWSVIEPILNARLSFRHLWTLTWEANGAGRPVTAVIADGVSAVELGDQEAPAVEAISRMVAAHNRALHERAAARQCSVIDLANTGKGVADPS